MSAKTISIFTDGACSGNPGPGGWAYILSSRGQVQEGGDHSPSTTNNQMEMMAVLMALSQIEETGAQIKIYTDSVYVIRGITQWIWGWQKNNWKTADGSEVANRDLWIRLQEQVARLKKQNKFEWHYVRGHVGTPGNERCDKIAVAYSKKEFVNLYRGSADLYLVDLSNVPADTSLPEIKYGTEKKVAFSYLSNIGGIVYRHKTWGSCERRVKGQSGAKFKKSSSASNEGEILREWGLSPTHSIIDGE